MAFVSVKVKDSWILHLQRLNLRNSPRFFVMITMDLLHSQRFIWVTLYLWQGSCILKEESMTVLYVEDINFNTCNLYPNIIKMLERWEIVGHFLIFILISFHLNYIFILQSNFKSFDYFWVILGLICAQILPFFGYIDGFDFMIRQVCPKWDI